MSKTYYQSPFGIARHPWLSKPDTKFNSEGLYKVALVLTPSSEVEEFVDRVTKEAQEAFEAECEKMTPADRKKYTVYVPIEKELDDQGNETGNWVAHFKQNVLIKRKDGTEITVKIGIKDASGQKDVRKPVYGGSEIRVMYSSRPVKMSGLRQAGVRLDFAAVQVKKLSAGGGGMSFGAVGGGYEEDQENFDPAEGPQPIEY